MQQLHLFATGDLTSSFDTSSNNVLAYASALHDHNQQMEEYSALNLENGSNVVSRLDRGNALLGQATNELKRVAALTQSMNAQLHTDLFNIRNDTRDIAKSAWTNAVISKMKDMQYGLGYSIDQNTEVLGQFHVTTKDGFRAIDEGMTNATRQILTITNQINAVTNLQQQSFEVQTNNFSNLTNLLIDISTNIEVNVNYDEDDIIVKILEWMTNNWYHVHEDDRPSDETNSTDYADITNTFNVFLHDDYVYDTAAIVWEGSNVFIMLTNLLKHIGINWKIYTKGI